MVHQHCSTCRMPVLSRSSQTVCTYQQQRDFHSKSRDEPKQQRQRYQTSSNRLRACALLMTHRRRTWYWTLLNWPLCDVSNVLGYAIGWCAVTCERDPRWTTSRHKSEVWDRVEDGVAIYSIWTTPNRCQMPRAKRIGPPPPQNPTTSTHRVSHKYLKESQKLMMDE